MRVFEICLLDMTAIERLQSPEDAGMLKDSLSSTVKSEEKSEVNGDDGLEGDEREPSFKGDCQHRIMLSK